MTQGGAKDEHFSCFHSSCQWGLIKSTKPWPRLHSNMIWGQSLKVHLYLFWYYFSFRIFTKNWNEPVNHKHSKYMKTYCLPWTEFERFRALFSLVLASSPEFCLSLLIPLSFPDPSSLESISMGIASTSLSSLSSCTG